MTTAAIIERHIQAFNTRDEPGEPWAQNASMTAPGGAAPVGREAVLGFLRVFHTAFPDGALTIDALLVDGSRAAAEGTFSGTHNGPLHTPAGTVPPSGRPVSFPWSAHYRTEHETLLSEHLYFDQADFLSQLGLS